jgi:hypothetical protein
VAASTTRLRRATRDVVAAHRADHERERTARRSIDTDRVRAHRRSDRRADRVEIGA